MEGFGRGGRNGDRGGDRGTGGDYGGRGGRTGGGYGRGGGGGDGRGGRGKGGGGNFRYNQQQQQQHQSQVGQPWRVQGQTGTHAPPNEGGSAWQNAGSVWNEFRGGHGGRGGGRGSDRGRGQPVYAQAPRPSVQPTHAHDSFIPEMQTKEISKSLPASSSVDDKNSAVPVRRPDNGGVCCIRQVRLLANHFPVKFNPDSTIWHYTVNVKSEAPNRNEFPPKITKSDLVLIRNKLASDRPGEFPLLKTAYDGEKNIFSAVQLPLPSKEIKVDISKGDDGKISSYKITVSLVAQLKLHKLKDYLSGNLFSIPRDVLQGIDVVMKENPTRRLIRIGGSFFPSEFNPKDDLGYGLAASRGFQHSLKPTSQGLALCLDSSTLAFRKRLPVIEYLKQQIKGFDIKDFEKFRRLVTDALRGLKVTVTHRITEQKYTIAGLTNSVTSDLLFTEEDPEGKSPPKKVNVVDYFFRKYGKNIVHKNIPCLDLGKKNKANHVPMEFCVLVEGQRYPKEDLETKAAVLLKKISMPEPKDRQSRIGSMVQSGNGPCGGGISQNFGIQVDTTMTKVDGLVIGPPELWVGTQNGGKTTIVVDSDKCQWNLVRRSVVSGTPIDRWAVIDFSAYDRCRLDANKFIPSLIRKLCSLGAPMQEPLVKKYEDASMKLFCDVHKLQQLLESVIKSAAKINSGRLQFILCVMARKDPGYNFLKYISETKLGVVTQCCLSNNANNGNDQYLSNLALKINAKLGGSNVELKNRLPLFDGEDHVMFIGAHVNHPGSRNISSSSIAAVVASVNWPAANRYAARVRAQASRKETIVDFGEMCLDLLETYFKLNKVKPENIVVFRDGVSEGQFDMVLNEELVDMKRAFQSKGYFPTITVIVAKKRHQTRLFPATEKDGSYGGNVSPGTVVDTRIVHSFEFDFYLGSHYGGIGTSKPTHYHVLLNEHKFSSDQLQKLIYNLCFTFSRSTKPVSLVPPVYYADIAAYRGRVYHEALEEGCSDGKTLDPIFKLHDNLKNINKGTISFREEVCA